MSGPHPLHHTAAQNTVLPVKWMVLFYNSHMKEMWSVLVEMTKTPGITGRL